MGFVADDYGHLLQDGKLPFWQESDTLFRPLRNFLWRDVLFQPFGMAPQPYHLVLLLLYSATVLSVWWLTNELVGRFPALIATAIFALFPRNHPLLFWISASQDLVAIPLLIAAVISWRHGRERITWLCYALALGFKETAIVCPVLLALSDLAGRQRLSLRKYLPLGLLTLFYALLVVLNRDHSAAKSASIYGLSIWGAPLAELRGFANILLPFYRAFGLRDLRLPDWTLVVAVLLILAVLASQCKRPRMMLFGIGWGIVALAPTSIFARSANADHYLMFPLVGVVVAIAAVLETHARVAVWFALAFSVAGCVQLIQYRNQWNAAAEQVQGLERELRARVNRPVERLTLVDLPHDGIANGVKGILIQAGLPERVQVRHNFFNARSQSESLVSRLTGCSTRPSVDQTYVYQQGALRDVSGPCATAIVDDDIGARPYEWH